MIADFTEHELLNSVGIVRACLAAGRAERIDQYLMEYRSAEGVCRELAAAVPPPARLREGNAR